jgi:uncharacterized membrane protein YdjX (TVP38/TMEM64 family)
MTDSSSGGPRPPQMGLSRRTRLGVVLLFLILMWAMFRLSGLQSMISLQYLHDGFEQHMVTGVLVFSALFALGNLMQVPGWIFLAAAVLALGPAWGGLTTYVAASLTCITTFGLIRLLGADSLRTFHGRVATRIFARLDEHPVQSVLLLRLLFQTLPALNYALAMSGIRFRAYLLGTLLGLPLPIAIYCLFFDRLAHWLQWPIPAAL